MSARRPLLAVALAALLAAGACHPYAYLTESGPRGATSLDCGHCHVEVYAEWSASTHAASWDNAAFVAATSGHRFDRCLGCHAPASVFAEGVPAVRADRREEGVHCVACHLDHGVLAGPVPSTALIDPHPVAAERAIYGTAELCGKCHEGTYREWLDAEGEETCQECHMPAVTRKVTQAEGVLSRVLVSFEDEVVGRRHSFHLDAVADFEGAVEARLVAVERRDDGMTCEVEVTALVPHSVPTGDFGFRRVLLSLEGLDAGGDRVGGSEWELYKELGTALAPGAPRRFAVPLPAEARTLRLALSRSKRDGDARGVHAQEWSLDTGGDIP